VLIGVTGSMKIATEETSGPVVPLIRFETTEDIVEQANGTIFGLVSYFHTKELQKV